MSSLNVSYQYATRPIVYIDRSGIPRLPQIPHTGFEHLFPDIAVRIVNEVGQKADKNAARMVMYNLLSENNWYNERFEILFLICVDYIRYTIQGNQGLSANTIWPDCVDKILSGYSGELVYTFTELQNVITPQQFTASSQNAGWFDNLKKEMRQMTYPGHQQNMGHPGGHTGHMHPSNYGGYPPPAAAPVIIGYDPWNNPIYGAAPMMPPQHQPWPPQGGGIPYHNPHQHHHNPGPGGHYMAGAVSGRGNQQMPDYAPRPDLNMRDYGDNRSQQQHDDRYGERDREPSIQQNRYFDRSLRFNDDVIDDGPGVLIQERPSVELVTSAKNMGESNVNRELHELGETRVQTLAVQEQEREIKQKEKAKIMVKPTVCIDASLSYAIGNLRAGALGSTPNDIHRQYAVIVDPMVSAFNTSMPEKLAWLIKGQSLTELAMHLGSILASDLEESTRTLIYEIDNKLAVRINTLLGQMQEDLVITSFVEDYPELGRFVLRQFGIPGTEKLQELDTKLTKILNSEFVKDIFNNMNPEDSFDTLPTGVRVGFFPTTYSLTLVPLKKSVLKLPSGFKRQELDPEKHQLVIEHFASLFNGSEDFDPTDGTPIEHHLLITADGVRYEVTHVKELSQLCIQRY